MGIVVIIDVGAGGSGINVLADIPGVLAQSAFIGLPIEVNLADPK